MTDPAPTHGPVHVLAGPDAAGQRLDRFLADRIGTVSRSRVKSLIEAGLARQDDITIREPAETVRPGVTYTLVIPAPRPARPEPQAIPLTILYEDSDLIVLDKPAGLVVHPAPGNPDHTLVNALIAHAGDSLLVGDEHRPGIVHRLDKDTSGVIVVAKTDLAMRGLTATFAARELDRSYLALAWGVPAPTSGVIEGAIGRDPRDRKRMAVRAHAGKPALTRYRTLRVWHASVALLDCRLGTGRTHQIRVHLSHAGHPLVGDPLYLRRVPSTSRNLPDPPRSELLDFPRQALHATRLGFAHPRTGRPLSFETATPADMTALIVSLDRALRGPQS